MDSIDSATVSHADFSCFFAADSLSELPRHDRGFLIQLDMGVAQVEGTCSVCLGLMPAGASATAETLKFSSHVKLPNPSVTSEGRQWQLQAEHVAGGGQAGVAGAQAAWRGCAWRMHGPSRPCVNRFPLSCVCLRSKYGTPPPPRRSAVFFTPACLPTYLLRFSVLPIHPALLHSCTPTPQPGPAPILRSEMTCCKHLPLKPL